MIMENKILDKILTEESVKMFLRLSYLRIAIVSALFLISYYLYNYWIKSYSDNIFYYISLLSVVYLLYSILVTFLYKKYSKIVNYLVPFIDFSFIYLAYIIADRIYQWYAISIFFLPTIILVVLLSGLSFKNYYTYVFSTLSILFMYILFSRDSLMFVESIFIWIPVVTIFLISLNISHKFFSIFNVLKKRELLDRFFDNWLVKRIEENPELLNLSWESKNVVIMFLDIRWFTTISEWASPQEVFKMLNQYLWSFSEIISLNHWMVDKYIWDCIMAVFWVDTQRDYLKDSYETVVQIIQKLRLINENNISNSQRTISIWIGVHIWNVIAWTVGHSHRMDYTVIWDAVNTASRIESLTRQTQDLVLFSKEFVDAYWIKKPFLYRWKHILKGKTNEIEVYTLKN